MTDSAHSAAGSSAEGPPPGWIFDPTTAQTRWWDGTGWIDHVLPPQPPANLGPLHAPGRNDRGLWKPENGPARASLILILAQLLGGLALIALFAFGAATASPLVLVLVLTLAPVLGLYMTIAAFVLAVIGLVIAVRRPTRKREAVFALVLTSLTFVLMILRSFAMATYGSL